MLKTRSIFSPAFFRGPRCFAGPLTVSVMRLLSLLIRFRGAWVVLVLLCSVEEELVCPARRFPTTRRAVWVSPWNRLRVGTDRFVLEPRARRDLRLEVVGGLERAVDAREPEVGHLVELAQRLEDGHADLVGGHLGPALAAQRVLDLLAEQARSSSETGRPLQALRTPAIAFSRVNGSVAPDRFTTMSCICSTVLNRLLAARAGTPAADRRRRPRRPGCRGPGCRCCGRTDSASSTPPRRSTRARRTGAPCG